MVKNLPKDFTLIEVVIAFVVSGIAIAAAATLISTSLWGQNLLRKRYSATEIAVSRIESLRSGSYVDLPRMEEDCITVNEQGVADPDGQFERGTAVGSEYKGSRGITVTVTFSWLPGFDPHDISISTVIADDAIMR